MDIECQGCYYTLCSFVCLTEDLSEILQFLWKHGCLRRSYACEKCGRKCAIGDKDLFFRCNRNTLDKSVTPLQPQNSPLQPYSQQLIGSQITPSQSQAEENRQIDVQYQIGQINHHQFINSQLNSLEILKQNKDLPIVQERNSENLSISNHSNGLQHSELLTVSKRIKNDSVNIEATHTQILNQNELNENENKNKNVNLIESQVNEISHGNQGTALTSSDDKNVYNIPAIQVQSISLNQSPHSYTKISKTDSEELSLKILKKSDKFLGGKIPKKRCNFKVSMKKGTFFEKSKLPIDTVCKFVVFWCCMKHPTQEFLRNELSLATRTVVDWSTACREICIHWAKSVSEKIGGDGVMVQIDEVKIQDTKDSKHSNNGNKFSFWGMEKDKERGKIFVVPVPACDSWSLLSVINDWILPGSVVISNCWKTYDCLKLQEFVQQTVVQSKTFVHPQNNAGQQNFDEKIDEAGSSSGGEFYMPRFGTRRSHHLGDLAEFMFKRRFSNHLERMHAFFKQISLAYPLH